MNKNNMKKIKSAVISSVMAVSAMAAPFSAVVMNASAANDNYAKLLQYSLYFYDANMCGKQVGETSALTWRDDCHTADEVDGGFHDAGDHAKFGLPAGYSASTLGWSYYEFKDAFNTTGQAAHLKTITDYFATYFKNSTTLSGDTVTNFVYQIGDGDQDHSVWCAPEVHVDNSRKTFSTSSGASDIAASYAAALAVNYVNFGNAEDLKYAKALFEFSTKYNQKATDGPNNFYASWDYYDDQAWAAGWLYRATNDNTYKDFLNTYMNSTNKGSSGMDGCQWGIYSPMSWNNVSMGAGIIQAEITGDSADWKKVTDYLNGHGANSNDYYFQEQWGSARYNTSQQMVALVATKYGAASYNEWAKGQMDYIMGNKGVGSSSPTCFVVGFADNSAKNPHHRAASGYSSFDEMGDNTQSSPNGHVLVGALVGGPTDANGSYNDSVKDYTANEVTLDYNATLVGSAAGLYSVYKTGTPDTSIVGVDKVSSGGVDTPDTTTTTTNVQTETTTTNQNNTTTTTTTSAPSVSQDITLTPNDMNVGTEKGDDGEMNNYAEFNPQGAKSVTLYYKVNSNDMNTSGGFGTWTGTWEQENFENISVPSDGIVAVDYTVPANVGSTVKAMVFWPHGDAVSIEKIVLHKEEAAQTTTTTTKMTTTTTTTNPNTSGNTKYGDADEDGAVNINDAVFIMQSIANPDKYKLSEQGRLNADVVDNGGGITNADALAIQYVESKTINASSFPITTAELDRYQN